MPEDHFIIARVDAAGKVKGHLVESDEYRCPVCNCIEHVTWYPRCMNPVHASPQASMEELMEKMGWKRPRGGGPMDVVSEETTDGKKMGFTTPLHPDGSPPTDPDADKGRRQRRRKVEGG
jgi:hypothetical protein